MPRSRVDKAPAEAGDEATALLAAIRKDVAAIRTIAEVLVIFAVIGGLIGLMIVATSK